MSNKRCRRKEVFISKDKGPNCSNWLHESKTKLYEREFGIEGSVSRRLKKLQTVVNEVGDIYHISHIFHICLTFVNISIKYLLKNNKFLFFF